MGGSTSVLEDEGDKADSGQGDEGAGSGGKGSTLLLTDREVEQGDMVGGEARVLTESPPRPLV